MIYFSLVPLVFLFFTIMAQAQTAENLATQNAPVERSYTNSFSPSLYDLPPRLTVDYLNTDDQIPARVTESIHKIPGLVSLQPALSAQSTALIQYRGLSSEYFDVRWNDLPNVNFTGVQPAFEPRFLDRELSSQVSYIQGAQSLYYGGGSLGGLLRLDHSSTQNEKYRLMLGEYQTSDLLFEKSFNIQGLQSKKLTLAGKSFATDGISQARDLAQTKERDSQSAKSFSLIYENESEQTSALRGADEVQKSKWVFNYSEQRQEDDGFVRDDPNANSKLQSAQLGYFAAQDFSGDKRILNKLDIEGSFYKADYFDFSDETSNDFYKSQFEGSLFTIRPSLKWSPQANRLSHQLGVQIDIESQSVYEESNWQSEFSKKQSFIRKGLFYIGQWQSQGSAPLSLNYGLRFESEENHKTFVGAHLDLQKDRFFIRLTRGFKRPSFYQLYSRYGSKKLNSQQALMSEVGLLDLASFLANNKESNSKDLTLDLKLFRIDFKDLISYAGNQFLNVNKANIEGAELIAQWKSGSFYIHENFIYSKSRDEKKEQILRKPDQIVKSHLGYKLERGLFELSHTFMGERMDINQFSERQKLPSQQILDLNSEYSWRQFAGLKDSIVWFFRINNILNSSVETTFGTPLPPRNVTLGLQYKN